MIHLIHRSWDAPLNDPEFQNWGDCPAYEGEESDFDTTIHRSTVTDVKSCPTIQCSDIVRDDAETCGFFFWKQTVSVQLGERSVWYDDKKKAV